MRPALSTNKYNVAGWTTQDPFTVKITSVDSIPRTNSPTSGPGITRIRWQESPLKVAAAMAAAQSRLRARDSSYFSFATVKRVSARCKASSARV